MNSDNSGPLLLVVLTAYFLPGIIASVKRHRVIVAIICILIPIIHATNASAQTQQRFYDSAGRPAGSAVPLNGGAVEYFDGQGRRSGTSTTSHGTTTFFDAQGRRIGSTTTPQQGNQHK